MSNWLTVKEFLTSGAAPGYYWCRSFPTDTEPTIVLIDRRTSGVWFVFECGSEPEQLERYNDGVWQFLPVAKPE